MPKLTIDIEARLAQFQDSLDSISRSAGKTARQIGSAFGNLRTLIAGALGGVIVTKAVQSFQELAAAADAVGKRAQGLGIGAEALQGLEYGAKQSGLEIEAFDKALGKLAANIADFQAGAGEAKDAFAALGFSAKSFQGLGLDQQFQAVADRISKLGNSGAKTALVMKIFGERVGRELVPYLNEGAEGITRLQTEARDLGGVFSDQLVEAATRFNDSMARLDRVAEEAKIRVFGPLIASLADLGDAFTRAATRALTFGQKLKLAFSGDINLGRYQQLGAEIEDLEKQLAAAQKEDFAPELRERIEGGLEGRLDRARAERAEIAKLMEARDRLAEETRPRAPAVAAAPKLTNVAAATAAARAAAGLEEARGRQAVAAEQRLAQVRLELLDRFYSEGLIAENDYWSRRLEIQRAASEASTAALEREIEVRRKAVAAAPRGSAEYFTAVKDLEDALARRNQLEEDFANVSVRNYLDAEKAAEGYADEVQRTTAELLDLKGKTAEALALTIDLEQRTARRRASARGDEGSLVRLDEIRAAKIAVSEFNDERARGEDILRDLAIEEERIQNARRVGAVTELEALAQTSAQRQKAVAELRTIEERLRGTAQESGLDDLTRKARDFSAEIDNLAANSDLLKDKFDSIAESAFGDFFNDVISGSKSAREALEDFGKTIVNEVNKLVAQELGRKLSQSIFGIFGGGESGAPASFGGILSKLFGGGGGGGGAAAAAPAWTDALLGAAPGFAIGGAFTVGGAGGVDSRLVAFRATPGERVTVDPPGRRMSPANNVIVNVSMPGGQGGPSAGQVGLEVGMAVQRALRRNG